MANSAQSNVTYSSEIFKQYLMQISTGIVWKNTSRANENDSTDLVDIYLSELFVVANRGLLNFNVIKSFPRSVLLNAGIPEAKVEEYASDKTRIPVNLRNDIVKEYEKALTSKDPTTGHPAYYNKITGKYEMIYTESNNYYRMLMGLPNKEDTDYVYNTDPRWDTETPIHLLPLIDRLEMENEGILAQLLKNNPSKEYISYLGRKSIDPFKARIADRFEILYQSDSPSEELNRDFSELYNNARQLTLSVYYNGSLRKTNILYENFMAMCILFMAIQGMLYKYLQVDITRDFYDTESLKLVYDSYGVPFYNEIPLEYHRKIVKNINKLISYKGSSKVFFDLFDIFDLGSMDIYSYFLIKTHLMDSNGNPSFIIKKDENGNDIYDEEGNPVMDPKNYDIKFSKVKIYDDPALSISDEANDIEYEYLTVPDPYWIEDADLINKIANEEFNYLESKYIGIQTIFDLMKITYENAYIFRIISDNKELTEKMEFRWSDLGVTCSIFDIFIYLASLYCRYYGYEGVIDDKLPAIMDTLGYDFSKSSAYVYSKISNDPNLKKNSKLLKLVKEMRLTNLSSVNDTYDDVIAIRDLIIDGYVNATTIDEYRAYRELYDSIMISKEVDAVYTDKKTGKLYETFTDILSDSSPELMQRYLLLLDENIEDEMVVTIDQLEKIITSLKYLELSTGIGSNSMIESLFRILKFFKSAKAELVGYNIIYTITMRGINYFKMMDIFSKVFIDSKVDDYHYFIDIVNLIKDITRERNELILLSEEIGNIYFKIHINDYINKLTDMLYSCFILTEHIFKEEQWYIDYTNNIINNTNLHDLMELEDKDEITLVKMIDEGELSVASIIEENMSIIKDELVLSTSDDENLFITDNLDTLSKLYMIIDMITGKNKYSNSLLALKDGITEIINSLKFTDELKLSDEINLIISSQSIKDKRIFIDNLHLFMNSNSRYKSILNLISNLFLSYEKEMSIKSNINISDILNENRYTKVTDKIRYFRDKLELNTNELHSKDIIDYSLTMDTEPIKNVTSYNHEDFMFNDFLYEYDSNRNLKPVV